MTQNRSQKATALAAAVITAVLLLGLVVLPGSPVTYGQSNREVSNQGHDDKQHGDDKRDDKCKDKDKDDDDCKDKDDDKGKKCKDKDDDKGKGKDKDCKDECEDDDDAKGKDKKKCKDDDDDGGYGMTVLCHIPPDNPEKRRTLTVNAAAVADHLAHGDYLGPCH